jgi:hypothetical protein
LPMYTHQWGVDEIGIIYNDDGVYDPETGEELVPPTPMDGWHVNCISETLPEELEDYLVRPSSPVRIFAA